MEDIHKILSETRGEVTLPLNELLTLLDFTKLLVETTDTHKDFLKKFRISLAKIVFGLEDKLDLSDLYSYYKDLDFKPIKEVKITGTKKLKLVIILEETEEE